MSLTYMAVMAPLFPEHLSAKMDAWASAALIRGGQRSKRGAVDGVHRLPSALSLVLNLVSIWAEAITIRVYRSQTPQLRTGKSRLIESRNIGPHPTCPVPLSSTLS